MNGLFSPAVVPWEVSDPPEGAWSVSWWRKVLFLPVVFFSAVAAARVLHDESPYLIFLLACGWVFGVRGGLVVVGVVSVAAWATTPNRFESAALISVGMLAVVGSASAFVGGRVRRRVSTTEDMSKYHSAAAKRWRLLADSVPNIVLVCDPFGRVLYYNRRWHEYVGGVKPKGVSDPAPDSRGDWPMPPENRAEWVKMIHPDERPGFMAAWGDAVGTGAGFGCEFRLRAKSEEYRWFLCRGVPLRDGDRVAQWYVNLTDVHDSKMTRIEVDDNRMLLLEQTKKLEESDRKKDRGIAMVAHELRGPLTPVFTNLQILRMILDGDRDWGAVERVYRDMKRHVETMRNIVDELLDLSRMRQGKVRLARVPTDLCQLVDRVVAAQRPEAVVRGHRVMVSLPAPVVVDVDVARMERVVTNLIVNACKYTDNGGTIRVSVASNGGRVLLRVRDTGVGLPPEAVARIFDIYTQAERSLDRSSGGLGIGLSLVKEIVEQHGGEVKAASGGLGMGSEFTVALPESCSPAEAPASPSGEFPIPQPSSRSLSLLVVDDNRDAAESLGSLLKMYGHTATIVHDGVAAIRAVEKAVPDAVLLDLGLPGVDGFSVCKTLRSKYGTGLRIIAVTGYNSEEDRKLSAKVGFNAHLTKPVDTRRLNALLVE